MVERGGGSLPCYEEEEQIHTTASHQWPGERGLFKPVADFIASSVCIDRRISCVNCFLCYAGRDLLQCRRSNKCIFRQEKIMFNVRIGREVQKFYLKYVSVNKYEVILHLYIYKNNILVSLVLKITVN